MIILLTLLMLPAGRLQQPPPAYPNWETVVLDAPDARVSALVSPTIGGRLLRYGLGGENLLFDNPAYHGKTLANTAPNALAQGYTGYNLDLGPETRGLPRHLALWMGPYTSGAVPGGVRLVSAHDPAVGMTLSKEIVLDPKTGALDVRQSMKNTGDRERSYCLWDRTLCKGGGFAFFPLHPRSGRPSGWSVFKDGKYVAGEHPQVKVIDGVLVAKAEGKSSKLGADSDAGWIAYVRGRQLLVKYFPYDPDGRYTDGGNSVELYFDPNVCELEPLSPEVPLKPGEEYVFPERWLLLPLDRDVASPEEARELVKKIPSNPFKKQESPR